MQIRVISSVLIGGIWHEPGVGNYAPDLANHLISIGAAEPYETKTVTPEVTKLEPIDEKKSLSASPPAPASQRKTLKRRKGSKPSSSTTTTD